MKDVGVLEAKTNLSALIAEVEQTGAAVGITRHGKRVARLVPEASVKPERAKRPWQEVIAELNAWREDTARRNPGLAEPYDLRADRDAIE